MSRVSHRLSLSCIPFRVGKTMPPKKRNQSASKKPTLLFDEATFQAEVSAAVTAVMAHLNANNANVSKGLIGIFDPSNGQQQPTPAYPATQEPQPNPLKRKLKIEEGGTSAQGPSEGQRAEAVNTPTNPSIPTPTRPNLEIQPMMTVTSRQTGKTERRKRNRHARKERQRLHKLAAQQQQVETPTPPAPARPLSQVPGIGSNPTHNSGVKFGLFKGKFSKWRNEEGTRVYVTLTKHLTPTTNTRTNQPCQ